MRDAALITGAAKRIGRAIALALAERGYDIALHYNRSRDAAAAAAEEIRAKGVRCELLQANLADADAVRQLVQRAMEALPDCCVLVNNASIFERAPLAEMSEDLLDRTMAIHFRAPLVLSRAFAARRQRGSIVNILDTKIEGWFTPYFAYTLSKKALADFTLLAAKALAPGIRVNGVAPGLILPPPGESEEYLQRLAQRIPARRHGGPADIASAVLYLLDSEFVTGQVIFADGGERLT